MMKNLPTMWETQIRSLGQEDSLEKGMATNFSITWRISWTEEPGITVLPGESHGQRSLESQTQKRLSD